MLRQQLLIAAVLFWSAHCYGIKRFSPHRVQLKRLLREPPLKVDANALKSAQNDVEELRLEQKLDHFAAASYDNRTWSMRYLRNAKYFQAGGPIFIFVGGEWEISNAILLGSHMHDIARQHSGMLYYTEHRYYGQSWPEGGATVENLKYLNVRQALADLAYFIQQQKATNADLAKSKVILAGGSYSASMVTWFMKLYPGVATASWASSAPLIAKLNFYEYLVQAGESIRLEGGSKCYNRIEAGMEGLVELLETSEGALQVLKRLHICDSFDTNNDLDVITLFALIADQFASIVQYFSDQIKLTCDSLLSLDRDDDLEAFLQYLVKITQPEGVQDSDWCQDYSYASIKKFFSDTENSFGASSDSFGARSWFYQTCNEFGWYMTTAESCVWQPFARQVPLRYFQQLCLDVFGGAFTPFNMTLSIQHTNDIFADNTSAYPNVFFTHGQLDPWRTLGAVRNGRNVIVIPGYSHVADLGSIDLNDSVAMNVAKLKVAAFLNRFLRQS